MDPRSQFITAYRRWVRAPAAKRHDLWVDYVVARNAYLQLPCPRIIYGAEA